LHPSFPTLPSSGQTYILDWQQSYDSSNESSVCLLLDLYVAHLNYHHPNIIHYSHPICLLQKYQEEFNSERDIYPASICVYLLSISCVFLVFRISLIPSSVCSSVHSFFLSLACNCLFFFLPFFLFFFHALSILMQITLGLFSSFLYNLLFFFFL
jgi:hypothetical protein